MTSSPAATLFSPSLSDKGYHSDAVRQRIAAALIDADAPVFDQMSEREAAKLFRLNSSTWRLLAISERDERALATLRKAEIPAFDTNYARLALSYVTTNARLVRRLYAHDGSLGDHLYEGNADGLRNILRSLDAIDSQSLFAFNVFGTLEASSEGLATYFGATRNSHWIRQHLLYPFVYYNVTVPTDDYLDRFLSFIIPERGDHATVAAVAKLVLAPDVANDRSLAFRAYIALLCHPHDACELLITHVEHAIATDRVGDIEREIAARLADAIPIRRTLDAKNLASRHPAQFVESIEAETLELTLGVKSDVAELLASTLSLSRQFDGNPPPRRTSLQQAIHGLRWNPYPTYEDFAVATARARRWRFCTAGRLLIALVRSLYLIEREEASAEIKSLIYLYNAISATTPYMYASPRGADFLARDIVPIANVSRDQLESSCDHAIGGPQDHNGRTWIKAAHWSLRSAEANIQPRRWLALVRKHIPLVAPPYLSGIDWRFVRDILRTYRIQPFEGNTDGIYTLLLMQLEDRAAEATPLRTAIEPFVDGHSMGEVVSWMMTEYGDGAIALCRYFFTADHILMLNLASTLTAAVAERISALEQCVRQFGFGPLIREDQFLDELRELSSKLLLRNIGDERFDIPWSTFRKDAIEAEAASYDAHIGFKLNQGRSSAALGSAILEIPHQYRNGKVVVYRFAYDAWPLVNLVISIIQSYVVHPSVGIEIILSNRFRHDTMRQAFAETFVASRSLHIAHTQNIVQREIIDLVEEPVLLAVQLWLDRRMQTLRGTRPDALFDLTPNQDELAALVGKLEGAAGLPPVIDGVIEWIANRVEGQVILARDTYLGELPRAIVDVLDAEYATLNANDRFRVADVDRVFSAIRTGLTWRVEELSSWFATANKAERRPLCFSDLKVAVDGLYERSISDGKLIPPRLAPGVANAFALPPEKVRLGFDLVSEIYRNAIKHKRRESIVRIRMSSDRECLRWVDSGPGRSGEVLISDAAS